VCLAAAHNPFISPEAIIEQTVVAPGLGLLVGEEKDRTTLLYLWQHEQMNFLVWLAHVARWVALSPDWRKAQGWKASLVPPRIILAVPAVSEGLREAATVLSPPVTVVRYRWADRGTACALAWDHDSVSERVHAEDRVGGRAPAAGSSLASTDNGLTPEERDFFQQFV
jgi:hypothetical protein